MWPLGFGCCRSRSVHVGAGRGGALGGQLGLEGGSDLPEAARTSGGRLVAVGICVPGIAYSASGKVWAPNIPGWDQYPLLDKIRGHVPSVHVPIVFESDRSAYVAGEPWRGEAAVAAVVIGLGFAAIYPTTLAIVGERFAAFTGTAFSVVIAVGLVGGMLAPWLAGKIAEASTLRQGLIIPVVNCAMIVVLTVIVGRKTGKAIKEGRSS